MATYTVHKTQATPTNKIPTQQYASTTSTPQPTTQQQAPAPLASGQYGFNPNQYIGATTNQTVNPFKLYQQLGIPVGRAEEIRKKAENNIAMQTPDDIKNQAYNAFQQYYAQEVIRKARNGERLDRPNAWKQSIYDAALAQTTSNDSVYYTPESIMDRQKQESAERMSAMQAFLETQRDGYLKAQEALLGKARDQQVAELQKALEDAVADGKISVREAEAAFEQNKQTIEQNAYQDAERTKLAATNRGISNSQQMLGMMASDNARSASMINQNMTERDRRVADIKDRVNAIKNKSAIDIANANANYGYGLAGAQGQADMQYGTQMFDMYNQDYMLTRNQQFQLDSMLSDQRYQQAMQMQNMGFQQEMARLAQTYTLEQFAVQQGYDLQKMDMSQRYQLSQMHQSHLYNMAMQTSQQSWQSGESSLDRNWQYGMQQSQQQWQSGENYADRSWQGQMQQNQQNWQSGQNQADRNLQWDMQGRQYAWQSGENALDRAFQEGMQNNQFAFQGGENALNRSHELSMLNQKFHNDMRVAESQAVAAQNAALNEYNVAMQREMNKYTPGTSEYNIAQKQVEQAQRIAQQEMSWDSQLKIASEAMKSGKVPVDPGPKPTKPKDGWAVSLTKKFNETAPSWMKTLTGTEAGMKSYNDKRDKAYQEELKAWQSAKDAYDAYKQGRALLGYK